MTTSQLKCGCFHHCCSGIERTHLKTLLISCFSSMNFPGIDQDDSSCWRHMLCALVGKRLMTSLNEGNHIIVVTVTRISMLNIISVQKSNIELGVMPDFRPFLGLHNVYFVP